MSFTTPTNVRMFLNKTAFTTSESALIDMLILMVDGVIKNYCGWNILAKDYTATLNGDGTALLGLSQAPINTVTSLVVSDVDYTSTVTINSEDGTLSFTAEDGVVFTSGTSNISVAYNAGYTAAPDDLAYAASWLAAINFKRITEESIGIEKEKFNDIDVTYDKVDIPVMVKHVLDRYRYIGIY